MPFALGMVRKLTAYGREIYAADDHLLSPGNHSKYLAGHFVYPSPRSDTAGFLAELERIVGEHEIDVVGLRGGALHLDPAGAAESGYEGVRVAVRHAGAAA